MRLAHLFFGILLGHAAFYGDAQRGLTNSTDTAHVIHSGADDAPHPAGTRACQLRCGDGATTSLHPLLLGQPGRGRAAAQLEARLGMTEPDAYDMTEAAHQMTTNSLRKHDMRKHDMRKPGTVGLPRGVRVAILDQTNAIIDVYCAGEVCIRGDNRPDITITRWPTKVRLRASGAIQGTGACCTRTGFSS